jgi:hypothetical protein
VQPGQIERSMPDFSLPALNGPTVTLSRLRGHTVILVFPRGKVADEDGSDPRWCQLCHYQYAELAALERKTSFRAAQNIEVLFVLPYSGEDVAEWVAILPTQVATIDRWREQVPAWRDRLPIQVHQPEHVRSAERELSDRGGSTSDRLIGRRRAGAASPLAGWTEPRPSPNEHGIGQNPTRFRSVG